MAIQKSYEDPSGRLNEQAYHRVVSIYQVNYDNREASFDVAIYHTEAARRANKQPVDTKGFTISGDEFDVYFGDREVEVRKQVYIYLKTLPEYEGHIDAQEIIIN